MLAKALAGLAMLGAWAFIALFCVAVAGLIRSMFTRPNNGYIDPVIAARIQARREELERRDG